ncbi:rhomboid family intramembrane serine protease [bacterium]|nr:rhomboid family intramembrane serine protease [bacterium]
MPELVKNLLIINVLLFLGTTLLEGSGMTFAKYLILYYPASDHFMPHQFITHMFMHADLWHLFFNMFALFMFGSRLEVSWGPRRFLIFYIIAGLGAALVHIGFVYYQLSVGDINYYPAMLGASGAVYGILAAFAYYWPNTQLFILFIPFPVKAKYVILFLVFLELTLGLGNFSGDNIAHFAHLGGALVGFILVKIWNKTNRNSLY